MLVVAGVALVACGPRDTSPEGAVRQFLRATETGNTTAVVALLAPDSRKVIDQMVELATAQSGGHRRFKPEDLLAVAVEEPRYEAQHVEVVQLQGDRAIVRLEDAEGEAHEELHLVRVGGHWRVVLNFGGTERRKTEAETQPEGMDRPPR